MQFYLQTGGPTGWIRNDNWLVGEPCEDGWYGVLCCPEHFPTVDALGNCHAANASGALAAAFNIPAGAVGRDGALDQVRAVVGEFVPYNRFGEADPLPLADSQARYQDAGFLPATGGDGGRRRSLQAGAGGEDAAATTLPVPRGRLVAPGGCRSGLSLGAAGGDADRTRCRVVALQLASNNLTGALEVNGTGANVLCALTHLQVLSLGNNSLTGRLPDDVGPLPMLDVSNQTAPGSALPPPPPPRLSTCLPNLHHIDVEDNHLSGPVPTFIQSPQIRWARLGSSDGIVPFPRGNAFDYPADNDRTPLGRETLQGLEQISRRCEEKTSARFQSTNPYVQHGVDDIFFEVAGGCTGLPGGLGPGSSCDAFGGNSLLFVPKTSARSKYRCSACPTDWTGLIIAGLSLFGLTFLLLVGYAILVSKQLKSTQMWVSSFLDRLVPRRDALDHRRPAARLAALGQVLHLDTLSHVLWD